ncbi:hypothetical protein B0H13DRAFT_1913966 [Mycena leptocephala]|nr:hypothetical protein B0H13DRAFT_1913966 [Mycena leptocephala]
MSWGDMNAPNHNPEPEPTSDAPSSSSASPPEDTIKPYNPRGEYFAPPVPALASDSAAASSTHGDADAWFSSHSDSEPHPAGSSLDSYPGHVPTVTQSQGPSPSIAPLSLPLPASVLRVNVNTGPRVPIDIQLGSPHLRPDGVLAGSPYAHPATLSPYASPRSHAASPFHPPASPFSIPGELAYPESPQRYVNLSDLTAPPESSADTEMIDLRRWRPRTSTGSKGSNAKRERGSGANERARAKRRCLRTWGQGGSEGLSIRL